MNTVLRRILVVAVLFCSLSSFAHAQVKHLVYFTDKGVALDSLNEFVESSETDTPVLSKRGPERVGSLSDANAINIKDLPVCRLYVEALQDLGVTICQCLCWPNAVSCYVPRSVLADVRSLPFVRDIQTISTLYPGNLEPNVSTEHIDMPLSKGFTGHRYNYGPSYEQAAFVDIPAVHDAGISGSGVRIGLIGTGFKDSHPALTHMKLLAEHDFINNDDETGNEPEEDSRQHLHGTAMLSSLVGFAEGMLIGAVPNASVLLAKTEHVSVDQHVEEDRLAAAVEWLASQHVNIIVVPFGWSSFDDGSGYDRSNNDGEHSIASRALAEAYARGITVIAAAGDSPEQGIMPPGDAKNAVCVGGITPDGTASLFSAHGPTADGRLKPDVMGFAEGTAVMATADDDGYSAGSGSYGTDIATMQAAGVAGLLLSAHPHLRSDQVRDILRRTGGNAANPDNVCGYGKLSATCAVNYPNLSRDLSKYFVHKMFAGKDVASGTVRLHMSINGSDYWNEAMADAGSGGYIYGAPHALTGDRLRFYITYTTHEGVRMREPYEEDKVFYFDYGSMEIVCGPAEVTEVHRLDAAPKVCTLSQNYPNPFSSVTTVAFSLPRRAAVYMDVTDVSGRTVATLADGVRDAGSYQLTVNLSRLGSDLPNGVYLCRLRALGEIHTIRMLLAR